MIIETKFSIGDTVWFMFGSGFASQPTSGRVSSIKTICSELKSGPKIETLYAVENYQPFALESDLFESKEALINHLSNL